MPLADGEKIATVVKIEGKNNTNKLILWPARMLQFTTQVEYTSQTNAFAKDKEEVNRALNYG